jgi:hypothetical protein
MSNLTFKNRAASVSGPAERFVAVAPNDTAPLPGGTSRGLHVTVAGTLSVADADGNVVTIASGAGQYHPLRVARVLATGTTAGGIVALY